MGIGLYAFCIWESRVGCTILLPEDELDAEYKLMSNEYLKMSIDINPDKAIVIENFLAWKLFKFLQFADPPYIKEKKDSLPSKKYLQFR